MEALFSLKKPLALFKKAGINTTSHSAHQLVPEARASHQTLFTFHIYSGAERALILDTTTQTKYFKPTEHLPQWPEILALLYHLGKKQIHI